ncbi:MAG: hypothetical protein IV112_15265 [Methyloversatilis discipulorum]|uniref:hypothetical protein n=1 Tax=Methyloversatilis discipulorum TaxID=1119528 RepID=UPI0026EF4F8B|nr:hypothetical protein [Methyloversatilis discipulorum]MBT9518044.1 hypothetical protein [Methyloversatilis discipulorum]
MTARAEDWRALEDWCERAGLTEAPCVLADMARSGALDRLAADAIRAWKLHEARRSGDGAPAAAETDGLQRVFELIEDGFTPDMVSDAADLAGGALRLLRLLNSPGVARLLDRLERAASRDDGLERSALLTLLQALNDGSARAAGTASSGGAASLFRLLMRPDTQDALHWLAAVARGARGG